MMRHQHRSEHINLYDSLLNIANMNAVVEDSLTQREAAFEAKRTRYAKPNPDINERQSSVVHLGRLIPMAREITHGIP